MRYPTAGGSSSAEAQPFYVNSPYGISLAHNGNLTNATELKQALFHEDLRHMNTSSDSEVLLNVFAHALSQSGKHQIDRDDVFLAVQKVHERCQGAYAAVVMIVGYGIIAFRDPYGIRPLIYGKRETSNGTEYIVASESAALNVLGYEVVRDVAPGEAVVINMAGGIHTKVCVETKTYSPCIFEHVYFARPDSIIDGISVYKARMLMGKLLAQKLKRLKSDHDIDVVISIPDTSRTAALEVARELNLKYREGFVKNRYIPRTFIMPGQSMRKKSVRQKLNAIDLEFKGKNVLLIDDSIVRGTTSKQIIQMARESGARKVYFASAAPPVRYPNVYGIDMPSVKELLAYKRSDEEIAKAIGADWLVYQDLEDLIEATSKGHQQITEFDTSCFSGQYVTGDIDQEYLDKIENLRNDTAKDSVNPSLEGTLDLYNTV